MKSKRNWLIGMGIFLVLAFIFWGTRNQVDPNWTNLDKKLDRKFYVLDDAHDSLVFLYQQIHKDSNTRENIIDRVGKPFMPSLEFRKFKHYVEKIKDEKFVVFNSVHGSGTSTLTNRLARFLASDPANIMRVVGAVNFDMHYHFQHIGEVKDGELQQGKLLDFLDKCLENQDQDFVFVFDDIEKIEPETFFGPEFWYKLYNPDSEIFIADKELEIPPNLYMISVAHVRPLANIVLTEQHYRRIGEMQRLEPDQGELILFLQGQLQKDGKKLSDYPNIKPFVYAFEKGNEIISEEFNRAYTVGQWSPIREMYKADQLDEFLDYMIYHVNSFNPKKEMTREDFAPLEYAIQNEGRMKGSNFFSRQLHILEEKGFLTEFIVGLSFVVLSALFSLFIFKRREKLITEQIKKVEHLFQQFEEKTMGYGVISKEINDIKDQVDQMALTKKINYQEATFFYQYFYDKSRKIEIAKEAYQHFNDLIEVSLEDGKLSNHEYEKLKDFLNRIKSRIGADDYEYFKSEIDDIYHKYSSK